MLTLRMTSLTLLSEAGTVKGEGGREGGYHADEHARGGERCLPARSRRVWNDQTLHL